MRILYHHRTRSRDGQAVHIESLIDALRREGHEVIVVQPSASASAEFGDDAKKLSILRTILPRAFYELLEIAYNVVAYRRLRRAFLRYHPDVVYERYNLFLLAGAWLRARYRVPLLLEINAPLVEERASHGGLGLPSIARFCEHFVWRKADAVFPVTEVLAEIAVRGGVQRDRIAVIPNGIDPEDFTYRDSRDQIRHRLGLDGRLVLGFTGFVRTWHALDCLVDYIAERKRRELLLFVVGDGPARVEIEEQADRLGVADQVRFTGVVARERVPELVGSFDVALQPAATSYASPLKLFEYMAMGCAILAPAQRNLLEILEDGRNAVLFAPGDRQALYDALDRLLSDERLRLAIAMNAKQTIELRGLTWRANARRVANRAESLVDGHPSRGRAPVVEKA